MRSAFGLLAVFLAHEVLASQPVQFSEEPKVIRQGTQSVIVFAVAKPTDVEVAVLDRNAKVIRHLAAGVLGGKEPPPAPLKAGLKQRIEWDGEDDLGKPAKNGPFSVRIRLGMSVDFGRMIGGSPYTGTIVGMPYRAPVNGLAVDAKGELIIKMQSSVGSHGNSGLWPWHIRRFDRQGKYVKTILPYPPSTDAAKASGFQLLRAAGFTPANQNSLYPRFLRLWQRTRSARRRQPTRLYSFRETGVELL
ncbi:MAG: hypothetical protein KatS3mg105_1957 [Gemmatales bacterium]|nr:MAG: hypothetical protein KatS3mg105_1957 [Gemmatales bacterium]